MGTGSTTYHRPLNQTLQLFLSASIILCFVIGLKQIVYVKLKGTKNKEKSFKKILKKYYVEDD